MELRRAIQGDSDRIREIAEQSFQASYALSPKEIEAIVEAEFSDDAVESRLDDDGKLLLVAEQDESLLGFTEARVTEDDRGEVVWLHVDPTDRGKRAGTELFEHVLAELREQSTEEIQATVMSQNEEGGEFFERFEFDHGGRTDREIGDKTFHVELYTDITVPEPSETSEVPDTSEITVDGERRFIDKEESIPGDKAPFLLVFEEEHREERYGFYCTNCGSFTDSVDGLGKVVCENCGNVHRPDDWDASYL